MAYTVEEGGPITPNVVFAFLSVLFVLLLQREHARNCYVLPLQKNAARLFILAPVYSVFLLLTAYVTPAKPMWDICMAFVDGYALYCFFGLVVLGAGGEDQVIALLEATLPKVGAQLRFPVCLCLPVHFASAQAVYTFLKNSVLQVLLSRPVFLAASALSERLGTGPGATLGERGFRLLSLVVLVYAVMTIGRTYHLVHRRIWPAFNPVAAFMVVKGFILLITVQDFVIAIIFSARDPHYEEDTTRAALAAYSLVVSIEGLLYLVVVRHFLQPRFFATYSPRASIRMTIGFQEFLEEVYYFHNVFDGDLPPMAEKGASIPLEDDLDEDGTPAGGVSIRVLNSSAQSPSSQP